MSGWHWLPRLVISVALSISVDPWVGGRTGVFGDGKWGVVPDQEYYSSGTWLVPPILAGVTLSDDAINAGRSIVQNFPEQEHHLATNKNSIKFPQWTLAFEEITDKYGLSLNGSWNKIPILQKTNHPQEYHQWVYDAMERIDAIAQGDQVKFLELYEKYVNAPVGENPWILTKEWWETYGNEWWDWWNRRVNEGLD